MMNEAQFWERCLKSRYFLNAAGNEVPVSHPEDRLFDSLPMPQSEAKPALDAFASHPEADLTGEFERDKALEKRHSSNENLIRRLNERSAGILKAQEAQKAAALQEKVQQRRQKLKDTSETVQDDLKTTECLWPWPFLMLFLFLRFLSRPSGVENRDVSHPRHSVKLPRSGQLQLTPEAGSLPMKSQKRPAEKDLRPHKALRSWTSEGQA